MRQVSDLEIIKRIHLENPWWESATTYPSMYRDMPKRGYFEYFYLLVSKTEARRAMVLMGPRRVGKTVLLHQMVDAFIDEGKSCKNILYVSIDTPIYMGLGLEELLNLFISIHEHAKDTNLLVIFDEIQYLKNWEQHLKSLVDTFPNYKFVASGSAAAALQLASKESGAGRFTDFVLPPLTFAEYLHFIGRETELLGGISFEDTNSEARQLTAANIEALNEEFINYLNYGGYPEAVLSSQIRSNTEQFIKADIIDKVLLNDLPSLYGIQDIQELNGLFSTIAYNTGGIVSLEKLSQTSGVAKNTIKRYLDYLEAAFLIRRVDRVDKASNFFKRATNFKAYLTNPSMRAALFGFVDTDSAEVGLLAETAIYSQWLHSSEISHLYYSYWKKGEVDVVYKPHRNEKPIWCCEVKWSDRVVTHQDEFKAIVEFCEINDISDTGAIITTKTHQGLTVINGRSYEFVPCALHAYLIGKNLIRNKLKALNAELS